MRRRSSGRSTVVTPGIAWVRGRYGAIFWAALTAGFRVGLLPAGDGVPAGEGQFNPLPHPGFTRPERGFSGGHHRGAGGPLPPASSPGVGPARPSPPPPARGASSGGPP